MVRSTSRRHYAFTVLAVMSVMAVAIPLAAASGASRRLLRIAPFQADILGNSFHATVPVWYPISNATSTKTSCKTECGAQNMDCSENACSAFTDIFGKVNTGGEQLSTPSGKLSVRLSCATVNNAWNSNELTPSCCCKPRLSSSSSRSSIVDTCESLGFCSSSTSSKSSSNAKPAACGNGIIETKMLSDATRRTSVDVGSYLLRLATAAAPTVSAPLDIDYSGVPPSGTSDGIMIQRYIQGIRGPALINGAVATDAQRKLYIQIYQQLRNNINAGTGSITFDVDGNGIVNEIDASAIVNRILGFSGTSIIKTIPEDATRNTTDAIAAYIDGLMKKDAKGNIPLDIDGNGGVDALTDGILLTRYVKDMRDNALTDGVIGNGATRKLYVQIYAYLHNNADPKLPQSFDIDGNGRVSDADAQLIIRALFGFTGSSLTQGEDCDDGNKVNGDGCSATCTLETQSSSANSSWSSSIQSSSSVTAATGNLYVTQDVTRILSPHQLLGGVVSNNEVLRLAFHTEYEPVDVRELQLTMNIASTSVDRFELYAEGATSPFGIATRANCGSENIPVDSAVTFCAKMTNQQFVVPKDGQTTVLVKAFVKDNYSGGVAGETVQPFLFGSSTINDATGLGSVHARGMTSNNSLVANNADGNAKGEIFIGTINHSAQNATITGVPNVTVMSKIAAITNANPNSSLSVNSAFDLGVFKITAAPNNNTKNGSTNVTLSSILFNVTTTNVGLDATGFKFYTGSGSVNAVSCTALTTAGNALVPATMRNLSGSFLVRCTPGSQGYNAMVAPGGSTNITLRGNVTHVTYGSNTNYQLNVALTNFSDSTKTSFGYNQSHFEWLNRDDTVSTKFLWVDSPMTTIQSTNFTN